MHRFLKICPVRDRSCAKRQGCLVHCVGIEGIFDIVQVFDQHRIAHRIADTHTCHSSRLREGLYHQKVVIFFNQWQRRSRTEIHIGFIHNHDHIRVGFDDCFHILHAKFHTGRSVRVRKNNSSVFPEIVLFTDRKIIGQRNRLIRDPKHICPHIIKRISNIREQNRFFRIEKGHKNHCQHIVGTYAHKYLVFLQLIEISDSFDQHGSCRIRIQTHTVHIDRFQCFCHFR